MVKRQLDLFLELGKVRISSLATVSMIAGYILAHGGVSWRLLGMIAGVFLIACGSSVINHIQDRKIDGRMARTNGRPLPSGRVGIRDASVLAVLCIAAGSAVILAVSTPAAVLLGWLAIAWYNGVYTPLKRYTAFAAVPGGVVGAIPPVIGWAAGGGAPDDPRILAVAVFFFLWQVPHFWLLLLFSCGRDYERAGLPSLTRIFSFEQIARITFVWILATAVACLAIPLFGVMHTAWVSLGLVAAGLWIVLRSRNILFHPAGVGTFRLAFRQINLYVFWVISLLAVDGILG